MSRKTLAILTAFAVLVMVPFATAQAAPDGKALYTKSCQSCHGVKGDGNAKMAKMMKLKPETLNLLTGTCKGQKDEQLFKSTKDGKGKMKGFGKKLSDADINAIVAYVRTLQKADGSAKKK